MFLEFFSQCPLENNYFRVHFGVTKEWQGSLASPGVIDTAGAELVLTGPVVTFFFFCCRLCSPRVTHVHKSARWCCNFSKIACDFVRGRVGTYHEISFTAAGLDLWGPCCQSLSLSCCVALCNSLSSAPRPNTSWAGGGVGRGWGAWDPGQGQEGVR